MFDFIFTALKIRLSFCSKHVKEFILWGKISHNEEYQIIYFQHFLDQVSLNISIVWYTCWKRGIVYESVLNKFKSEEEI
jgi:hypothetical protein